MLLIILFVLFLSSPVMAEVDFCSTRYPGSLDLKLSEAVFGSTEGDINHDVSGNSFEYLSGGIPIKMHIIDNSEVYSTGCLYESSKIIANKIDGQIEYCQSTTWEIDKNRKDLPYHDRGIISSFYCMANSRIEFSCPLYIGDDVTIPYKYDYTYYRNTGKLEKGKLKLAKYDIIVNGKKRNFDDRHKDNNKEWRDNYLSNIVHFPYYGGSHDIPLLSVKYADADSLGIKETDQTEIICYYGMDFEHGDIYLELGVSNQEVASCKNIDVHYDQIFSKTYRYGHCNYREKPDYNKPKLLSFSNHTNKTGQDSKYTSTECPLWHPYKPELTLYDMRADKMPSQQEILNGPNGYKANISNYDGDTKLVCSYNKVEIQETPLPSGPQTCTASYSKDVSKFGWVSCDNYKSNRSICSVEEEQDRNFHTKKVRVYDKKDNVTITNLKMIGQQYDNIFELKQEAYVQCYNEEAEHRVIINLPGHKHICNLFTQDSSDEFLPYSVLYSGCQSETSK